MKQVTRFFCVVWKIFFLINFALSLLILYPLFYFFCTKGTSFKYGFALLQFWGRYLINVPGIRIKLSSEGKLPKAPYIICANHTSYLDIILTYCIFPDYFVFMGKKELGDVPVFNVFFKKMNILVDRKSTSGAHRAFLAAGAEIDKGNGVAIFPEGTISKKAPEMLKFKNGAFKLAAEKNVPIVPVTFSNNWEIMGDGAFWKAPCRPGTTFIHIHPAIMVASTADIHIEQAKEEVHALIEAKISEYLHPQQLKPLTT
jgi:1-acyl-sn-glycerol-3-phosphate acyltransferase